MQSKQQKQIKEFLVQTFGGSRGGLLFSRQEKTLDMLIKIAASRSKSQMKALVQTILPRRCTRCCRQSCLQRKPLRICGRT